MKTEKFDEEFRRKLLGLPAEADPGEVERIHGFVNASKPALPSFGWGKLLLYGVSSLLLIGSLSYNFIQNYRNTHLQSSIDSLTHRSPDQTTSYEVIRHDTVYITRSGTTIESTPLPTTTAKATNQKPLGQLSTNPPAVNQRIGSVAMASPKAAASGRDEVSDRSGAVAPSGSIPTELPPVNTSTGRNQGLEGSELPGQVRTEANESVTSLPPVSTERSTTSKTRPTKGIETRPASIPTGTELVAGKSPTDNLSPGSRSGSRRSTARQQTSSGKRQPVSGKEVGGLLANDYYRKQNQPARTGQSPAGFTAATTESLNSSELDAARNRHIIVAEPLASQQRIPSNQLAVISPSRPLVIPATVSPVVATRRSWHLTMPRLSVPKAQYRIGAGFTGGSDQVGGAILGELQLNRHWSVQAGAQVGIVNGFHYHDEQDFGRHRNKDFRQTYDVQGTIQSDIENIRLRSMLVQLPIQAAYHYPLGRQWGLRLGVGTELDLTIRSTVDYGYRENNRSDDRNQLVSGQSVSVFNNAIVSLALERSWKKWQFRAGPFISPQFGQVSYRPDDLLWGGNVQIFYRLGK